jgi:hypothetical protein
VSRAPVRAAGRLARTQSSEIPYRWTLCSDATSHRWPERRVAHLGAGDDVDEASASSRPETPSPIVAAGDRFGAKPKVRPRAERHDSRSRGPWRGLIRRPRPAGSRNSTRTTLRSRRRAAGTDDSAPAGLNAASRRLGDGAGSRDTADFDSLAAAGVSTYPPRCSHCRR